MPRRKKDATDVQSGIDTPAVRTASARELALKTKYEAALSRAVEKEKAAKEKWRLAVKNAAEVERDYKNEIRNLKQALQDQVKEAELKAYEQAIAELQTAFKDREEAKRKALARAEEKFDREYLLQVKFPRRPGRRGRPPKNVVELIDSDAQG